MLYEVITDAGQGVVDCIPLKKPERFQDGGCHLRVAQGQIIGDEEYSRQPGEFLPFFHQLLSFSEMRAGGSGVDLRHFSASLNDRS